MPSRSLTLLAAAAAVIFSASLASAGEPRWKKHDINPKSEFEAAGALDADNDGDLDIVSGSTWYEAPDWTPHKVRDVSRTGTYLNCFSTLPMDVNGDGNMDFITCSYFDRNVGWVENPGSKDREWAYHEIDLPGSSEAAVLIDLTGDGVPEILPNTVNTIAWYKLNRAGSSPEIKKYDFGNAAAGHGVGTGDINRDGRLDLLTPKGWFEAPEDPARQEWAWHPDWDLGATGIQILGRDLDGDDDADLVYGMGHNYGLYWLEQVRDEDGKPAWKKHTIDEKLAQVHTLLWADLDNDGQANELITGKRVYAHEVEPGATDASVVAWYDFNPEKKAWQRHVIYQGEPAKEGTPESAGERNAQKDFPAGTAGTGLEMSAVDIDQDGDIDLVCPGKSGLYLFENLGSEG